MDRSALVLGGTGWVGRRVVASLRDAGIATKFTYFSNETLADELGGGVRVDLRDGDAAVELAKAAASEGVDLLVHAAVLGCNDDYAAVKPERVEEMFAINVRAPMLAMQQLGPSMRERGGGDFVALGALDRQQSLPIPSSFAATQGALSAWVMTLAKELGGSVRANMLAVGLLDGGLSRGLDPKLVEDYQTFSALRRLGTADEVARAVLWLGTQNSYLNGEIVPVNGGV